MSAANQLHDALKDALLSDQFEKLQAADERDVRALSLAPAQCHQNAAVWAFAHPGCRVVEGWVLTGSMGPGTGVFAKHSVVATANGQLLDVTPRLSLQHALLFVRHEPDLMGSFGAAPNTASVW